MSVGKRKIIVDSEHYLSSTDSFRRATKKYWSVFTGKSVRFLKKNMAASLDPSMHVPFRISFEEPRLRNRVQFYEIEQKVVIKADPSLISSLLPTAAESAAGDPSACPPDCAPGVTEQGKAVAAAQKTEAWTQYVVDTLFPGVVVSPGEHRGIDWPEGGSQIYYDHAFEMTLPYSERELKMLNLTQEVNTANVTPRYNFYIEQYEKAIKDRSIPEQVLPNIYALKQKENNDSVTGGSGHPRRTQKDIDDMVSLGEQIPPELLQGNFKKKRKKRSHRTLQEEVTDKYFNNYGKYYSKLYRKRRGLYKEIREKYSSVLFSGNLIDNLGDYNEKKYLFPMYTEIEFLTDRNVYISKIFRETGLSERLMRYCAAHDKQNTLPKADFFESHEKVTPGTHTQYTEVDPKPTTERILKIKNFNTFDLLEWWAENVEKDAAIGKILGSSVMIGPSNKIMNEHDKIRYNYQKIITDLIFQSKFRKFALSFFRSYEAILRGNLCYDEALIYKIQKFKGKPRGKPIQTYFLCNSDKQELIKLIDTQVKYNTEYTYVLSAYQMVLGNQYYYKDLKIGTKQIAATDNDTESVAYIASFIAATRPSIKIIEVPLYAEAERIFDTPPVAPDIDIVPYRNINNRLLFNFKGSIGEYELMPISFNEEERRHYEKIRKAQKRPPRTPIMFRSDDPAAVFEIYRTTQKPKSYQDFKSSKLASVYTDVSAETIQKASAASYIERISPNTKYYYTFRSIDVHGHISYPSTVYEVEIIDDSGTVYSIVKTIDFEERTPRDNSRGLKKYLYIIPNLNHAMLNLGKSGLLDGDGNKIDSARRLGLASDGLQLGYQDDTLWGKRFKIRLTSRATGRKLDLNLNFAHKHIITEDEYRNRQGGWTSPDANSGGVTIAGLLFERDDRKITQEFYSRLRGKETQEEDLEDLL